MKYRKNAACITGLAVALALMLGLALGPTSAFGQKPSDNVTAARIELGRKLFEQQAFSNGALDFAASCSGCHSTEAGLPDREPRRHADYTAQSMMATKELTTRNTPTLLDVAQMTRLGWTGEYDSLEKMIEDKLTGEPMGWQAKDLQRARNAIHFTLTNEGTGGGAGLSYVEQFKQAYDVDLESQSVEQVIRQAAIAIADYTRSLESTNKAPWDAFVAQNRFHPGPNKGEDPEHFSFGLFSRIGNQEGRGLIRRPKGFTREAYEGFKTFFRTFGEEGESVGNCVACHVPPHFTDFALHNTGIGDTGAVKTPTLRNSIGTDPYMHNGAFATLEDAVAEVVRISHLVKQGEASGVDAQYEKMTLAEDDVAPLVAFLRQLNEVDKADFRQYLIQLESD